MRGSKYYNNHMTGISHTELYKAGKKAQQKDIADEIIGNDLPMIYAALCIVLHKNYGFDTDKLSELLYATQDEWFEFANKGMTKEQIIKKCEDDTGINLISR